MRLSIPCSFQPPLLCTALLACSLLALPAAAAPSMPFQAAIQTTYDQISAAFRQHDLNRFMSYFTDDYLGVDEKGARLNKEQARQGYEKQLGQMKTIQSRYVIQNLTPTAGGMLVEMKIHASGLGEKRLLFAKLHGTFTDDLWVRDLWVSTPQGWRLRHRQTLQDDLQIHPR